MPLIGWLVGWLVGLLRNTPRSDPIDDILNLRIGGFPVEVFLPFPKGVYIFRFQPLVFGGL